MAEKEKTPAERIAGRKTVRTTVSLKGFDQKRRALIEAEMRKAGIEIVPDKDETP
jgi:hypothetical protein